MFSQNAQSVFPRIARTPTGTEPRTPIYNMSLPTVKIVFDRKGRADEQHPQPIEVRITHDRKVKYLNLSIKVTPSQFRNGQVVNHPQASAYNEIITDVLHRVNRHIADCVQHNLSMNWNSFSLLPSQDESTSLLDYCNDRIYKKGLAPGTLKHYVGWLNDLESYGKLRSFSDITPASLRRYDEYLHSKRTRLGKPITQAAIYGYHKKLKAMINDAIVEGLMSSNPYVQLSGEIDRGESKNLEYLTVEEVERLQSFTFHADYLARARDLFIFSCYTGLAYADLMAFSKDKVTKEGKNYVLQQKRVKSGVPYTIVLLRPAMDIVKRYDWNLPKMSNQDYNKFLKQVAAAVGIKKRMHSHLARHTFGTLMLHYNVPIPQLQHMMGHTKITQTTLYAKVLRDDVKKAFADVDKKIGS